MPRIFGLIQAEDANTALLHWDTDLNNVKLEDGDTSDQKRISTQI
jgi:hypothetical protein